MQRQIMGTMRDTFQDSLKDTPRHLYLAIAVGIVFLAAGIWTIAASDASFITLSGFFSYVFIITGILEVVSAIINVKYLAAWQWSLVTGFIDMAIGAALYFHPQSSVLPLSLFVGFAALYRSAMAIGWAIELKKYEAENWVTILGVGILGLLLSFIVLWNPVFAGLTLVFYAGSALLMVGFAQIYLALVIKGIDTEEQV